MASGHSRDIHEEYEEIIDQTTEKRPTKKKKTSESKLRTNWSDDEVNALLDIWPHYQKRLDKSSKRSNIFIQMSDELKEKHNVSREPDQIQKKMSKLRQEFKKYNVNQTGAGPKEWPYLHQMRQIFGASHYYNRELANEIETNAGMDQDSPISVTSDDLVALDSASIGEPEPGPSSAMDADASTSTGKDAEAAKATRKGKKRARLQDTVLEKQLEVMDKMLQVGEVFLQMGQQFLNKK